MDIEDRVTEIIKPSAEEIAKVSASAEKLKALVDGYLRDHDVDAPTCFVGSFAKGTFLSNNDLDLFIQFPVDYPKRDMAEICLRMGETLIDGKTAYAEHPYSSGIFEGLEVDLVPCYAVKDTEHLMTPVDRTPFHTRYVLSKVDEELCDQIRLTKRFMKGIGAYGAEPDVRGFSGYLCEILTICYGSFRGLIEAGSQWGDKVEVVIEEQGHRFKDPLVVYDPVDRNRNVASAVHSDTLALFREACIDYLKKPSMKFFFPEERKPLSKVRMACTVGKHHSRLLSVSFSSPDVIRDNLYSQIWRTQYGLEKKLNSCSFMVKRVVHGESDGRFTIAFELKNDTIDSPEKHLGPKVGMEQEQSFLEKWKDNPYGPPYQENGRWVVTADRQYLKAADAVRGEIERSGIGKDVDPKSMTILTHDDTMRKVDRLLLTDLLVPIRPWKL